MAPHTRIDRTAGTIEGALDRALATPERREEGSVWDADPDARVYPPKAKRQWDLHDVSH